MPDMSMYDYLYERNKDNLDEIAIDYFGTEITYREFFKNIDKASVVLKSLGVKENDKVTISSPTTPETAYINLGLFLIWLIQEKVLRKWKNIV